MGGAGFDDREQNAFFLLRSNREYGYGKAGMTHDSVYIQMSTLSDI